MTTGRTLGPQFRYRGVPLVGAVATLIAVVAGHRELAELAGGMVTMWVSVVLGWQITPWAAIETDPTRVLKLDLLLVLVVVLGLFGVALVGFTIL